MLWSSWTFAAIWGAIAAAALVQKAHGECLPEDYETCVADFKQCFSYYGEDAKDQSCLCVWRFRSCALESGCMDSWSIEEVDTALDYNLCASQAELEAQNGAPARSGSWPLIAAAGAFSGLLLLLLR